MIVPSKLIRYNTAVTSLRGLRGMGADEFALANPNNACAPGLTLIGGSCFRSPGTQNTPYGPIAIPTVGADSNNNIAEKILGSGASCNVERVSNGPYAYEQNICRDAGGNIIGGADNIAETAFVTASLRNPSNPEIFNTSPTSPASSSSSAAGSGTNNTSRGGTNTTSGNGTANTASQKQQPLQSPDTVQGASQTKQSNSGNSNQTTDNAETDNTFLIVGAVAVGLFLLMKGGR